MIRIATIAAAGLMVAACNSSPGANVAAGSLIGGAAGAGIGAAATGGSTGGTVAGGIIGAGTGAVVGAAASQDNRWCRDYDRYGRPYRYRC